MPSFTPINGRKRKASDLNNSSTPAKASSEITPKKQKTIRETIACESCKKGKRTCDNRGRLVAQCTTCRGRHTYCAFSVVKPVGKDFKEAKKAERANWAYKILKCRRLHHLRPDILRQYCDLIDGHYQRNNGSNGDEDNEDDNEEDEFDREVDKLIREAAKTLYKDNDTVIDGQHNSGGDESSNSNIPQQGSAESSTVGSPQEGHESPPTQQDSDQNNSILADIAKRCVDMLDPAPVASGEEVIQRVS